MQRATSGCTAIEFLLVMLVIGLGVAPLMTLSRQQTIQSGVLDIEMRAQNLAHTVLARVLDKGYDALARQVSAGVQSVTGEVAAAGGPMVAARWSVRPSADDPTLLIVTVEVREVPARRGTGLGKLRSWIFRRAVSDPELSVRGAATTQS